MQVQPKNIAISKESSSQDEQIIPPRFWWLKRGAIGFGLLLAMLCALRFWWGHEAQRRIDSPASIPLAPRNAEFNYDRALSQILVLAANDEFAKGNDGAAVEYAHDAILLGDTLDRADQYLTSHLVALAIDDLDIDFLQQIAMGISISDRADRGASPGQVRSLIAALMDERAMRNGAVRASESEGMIAINFPPLSSLTAASPVIDKVFRPMEELNGVRIDEFESANARAYGQATFPAARLKLTSLAVGKQSAIEKVARDVSPFAYPPILPIEGHFKILVERRIAAIMLAVRLYSFDHQGKLPASLSELVPAYLPAVPRDPFDPANGPIRYLPMHDPPSLYCVGLNEKDDGGSEKYLLFSEPMTPRWHNEDVVYPLRGRPRISPAQDHQSDKKE
ncbi:MAG TPA: hypothetical protein VFW23_04475 [Tepidisphaeraceae bacterium]|nr:hypothetical protein [Tepidisphaeraceae bacterium]